MEEHINLIGHKDPPGPKGDRVLFILGTCWTLSWRALENDPKLADCDGYTDWTTRTIVVREEIEGNLGDMDAYAKKVARHEIVHAFLLESGLAESSAATEAWATNEEMVDWFARMGPRIYDAWVIADAIGVPGEPPANGNWWAMAKRLTEMLLKPETPEEGE